MTKQSSIAMLTDAELDAVGGGGLGLSFFNIPILSYNNNKGGRGGDAVAVATGGTALAFTVKNGTANATANGEAGAAGGAGGAGGGNLTITVA